MDIGRKELFWNYAATSMRLFSGIIILPFSLRILSSEEIGIWSIFLSLVSITSLLDFGFNNSFSRNVTYIYSGVKKLQSKGYTAVQTEDMDYGLLKSLLSAMKRYYGIIALLFLLVFLIASPLYLSRVVLDQYTGDKQMVWIAWFIFGALLAYELYTYYYSAILNGRGKVKTATQITFLSHFVRIIVTITFLLLGFQIISMVIGLFASDIVNRTLSYYAFYDKETKSKLANATPSESTKETIKIIAPNSIKLGLTSIGSFLRSKAIVLIAPGFLSLPVIGAYGISRQLVDMISGLAGAWYGTFYPKFSQNVVHEKKTDIKRMYIKSISISLLTFIILGAGLMLLGNDVLAYMKSKTLLLDNKFVFFILLFTFLDLNQSIASGILLAKNEVPFYKSSIVSGALTVLLMWIMFEFLDWGVWSLILSGGIVMSLYMNWKWPLEVAKYLKLKPKDFIWVIKEFWRGNRHNFKIKKLWNH